MATGKTYNPEYVESVKATKPRKKLVHGSSEAGEHSPPRILETLSGINSDIDSLEDVITALSDRLTPILQQWETPNGATSERTTSEEWSPLRLGAADMRNRLSNLREQVLDLLDRTDL